MKTILIIEDDTFLKSLEATKFTKEGFTVVTAMNELEIDTLLVSSTPDIILLDLMLPNTDGFTLLKKLKANDSTKNTPIIVFSNLSEDAAVKKAIDGGASAFMTKSNFTLEEVVEKIKTLIS